MKKTPIKEFTKFVDDEILLALTDIERLQENNRKHLQKLVYTNLVDRFDSMIDHLMLDNCGHANLMQVSAKALDSVVTEAQPLTLLMTSAHLDTAIDGRLRDSLRATALRQRHSKKLLTLFQALQPDEKSAKNPRVNISAGEPLDKNKPHKTVKCPYSICGFCDWLYSRRNAIVHGAGGSKFLKNVREQLKKLYKKEPAKTFKISIGSVRTAASFYKNVGILLEA